VTLQFAAASFRSHKARFRA